MVLFALLIALNPFEYIRWRNHTNDDHSQEHSIGDPVGGIDDVPIYTFGIFDPGP